MNQKRWRGFSIYLGIGLISIATIYPIQKHAIIAQIENGQLQVHLPVEMITILSLINPLFLFVVGLLLGMFLAKKVQLSSYLFQKWEKGTFWAGITKGWKQGVSSGLALGIGIFFFDILFRPWLPEIFQQPIEKPSFYQLVTGILYGGIVEELMMRWGLMTLFVYLIWKLFDRRRATPSKFAFILAIFFSAFFFSIGHYGATAAMTEITPLVLFRMLLLNGGAGIVFGSLYWKFQLETAMISHMSVHITVFILTWIFSF